MSAYAMIHSTNMDQLNHELRPVKVHTPNPGRQRVSNELSKLMIVVCSPDPSPVDAMYHKT